MASLIEQVVETCDYLGCPGIVFAKFCDIRTPKLSRVLNGHEPLTPELREKMARALAFITHLTENSSLPVCLHNYAKLERIWNDFRKNLAA